MNETMLLTLVIGAALVGCGYVLGHVGGFRKGNKQVMDELFKSGLLTPKQILTHYANEGNERARDTLAALTQYERELANKDKNSDV